MKRIRSAALLAAAAVLTLTAVAQPGAGQFGNGQAGNGGMGGRGGRMNPAVSGVVTAATESQLTVQTENGQSYTVRLGSETRLMDAASMPQRTPGEQPKQRTEGEQPKQRMQMGGQQLKAADLKVGDTVSAMGELDAATRTVTATMVMKLDPERARQMREMQQNFGKTWLAGKLTAVDELTLTMLGSADNAPHSFTVDENTSFKKRGEPVTLADIQTGEMLRVEGAVKDGVFLATSVTVQSMAQGRGNAARPENGNTPATVAKSAEEAAKVRKSESDTSKPKKKSSAQNNSDDEDEPPPPPPDGPPPGGMPPGAGGPPPMNFF